MIYRDDPSIFSAVNVKHESPPKANFLSVFELASNNFVWLCSQNLSYATLMQKKIQI